MIADNRSGFSGLIRFLILGFAVFFQQVKAQPADTVLLPIKTLRVSIYIFQDDAGQRNFSADSAGQVKFLHELTDWVNHRLANLDTLKPAMPSPFVGDSRVRIRLDTIYYIRDNRAWDCSVDIDAPYMRDQYVDASKLLDYRQKYQTLPIFIGANYSVIGGHSRNIGDRGYIAVRGYYEKFLSQPKSDALDECGRNLVHELGHCAGLSHNFSGGPDGDQCDDCGDNGCPLEGTSNNIMDYWPSYGYALSKCQFNQMQFCLNGGMGNISEAVINDSCYKVSGIGYQVSGGDTVVIKDTVYAHQDWLIKSGGYLKVTGYLSMPSDTKITLEAGASLVIDGGTIGNLCGDLWSGLRPEVSTRSNPARITVSHNGTIENAYTGILAARLLEVNLENSVFRNCSESLVFPEISVDSLSLSNCSFLITTKLNHYEEGLTPVSFLRTDGISRLSVTNSRFINVPGTSITDANWLGIGIIAAAGSIFINKCEFTNLTTALDLSTQFSDSKLRIIENSFVDNKIGIKTDFAGLQKISNNHLTLQRFNSGYSLGILLCFPDRFSVDHNRFESLYGGGQQAGLAIISPSHQNSPVFNNKFSNLPLGVYLDGPPAIDLALFQWAKFPGSENLLQLGPQLRFNEFDTVSLPFAVSTDSVFGSAIGTPEKIRSVDSLPPTRWNIGGYLWYNNQVPMVAFNGWRQGSEALPDHGLYWFMNYIGVTNPNMTCEGCIGGVMVNRNSELIEYLNKLANYQHTEESYNGSDIYQALQRVSKVPAVLRSSIFSSWWDKYNPGENIWLSASLASIAGNFVRADTLLTVLGTILSQKNLLEWSSSQPLKNIFNSSRQKSSADFQFIFPDLSCFRFVRPQQSEPLTSGFFIYPNPAEDYLLVEPNAGYSFNNVWQGRITSAIGSYSKEIRIGSWQDQKLNISDLPSGLYIIEFYTGNKYLGAAKLIKITHR